MLRRFLPHRKTTICPCCFATYGVCNTNYWLIVKRLDRHVQSPFPVPKKLQSFSGFVRHEPIPVRKGNNFIRRREASQRMKEINDTWYTIKGRDGIVYEMPDKGEARLAIREGLEVVKNTRKVFSSGKSDIRLYVSTDIFLVKEL